MGIVLIRRSRAGYEWSCKYPAASIAALAPTLPFGSMYICASTSKSPPSELPSPSNIVGVSRMSQRNSSRPPVGSVHGQVERWKEVRFLTFRVYCKMCNVYMFRCMYMYIYIYENIHRFVIHMQICMYRHVLLSISYVCEVTMWYARRQVPSVFARFMVVSQRCCAFGRMAWGPQESLHERFFRIVRFVVVSEPFSARFCVLQWFRITVGDADVIKIQDLGAGIPRFIMVSDKFGASCRTASGPQKEHPRSRSLHHCQPSNVAFLENPRSRSLHRCKAGDVGFLEHPRSRSLHHCQPSNVGLLEHLRSRNLHRCQPRCQPSNVGLLEHPRSGSLHRCQPSKDGFLEHA